jgi:hypothetical protein
MRLVFILLLSCGLAPALAGDQPTAPDMSSYPQTEAFRRYVNGQTNRAPHVQHLLTISEFSDAGLVAERYEITEHGAQSYESMTIRPEGPIFGVGGGPIPPKLTQTQLGAVASAIHELPPTNALPPIDELVLVSFRQGTNWVTHSYDKRSLPKAMSQIYDIRRARWVRNFTVQ